MGIKTYLLVPLIVALDALTKTWATSIFGGVRTLIPELLTLRVIENRGIMLSLGEQLGAPFAWAATLLGLILLVILAIRSPGKNTMRHLGIACMIGGALGNLLDRALHGRVLDFLEIWRLPIVNLADLAIMAGMGVLVIALVGHPTPPQVERESN